jgi:hypothetical protein
VITVKLHLSAEGRTLLARRHVLHGPATIVAGDAAGATHTSQATITIHTAKAPRGRRT